MGESDEKGRRRSEEEWRRLLLRQAESGAGIVSFCRAESISAGSFYRWRRRLAEASDHPRTPSGGEPSTRFVDLGTLGGGGSWELELTLGGGLVLRLRST